MRRLATWFTNAAAYSSVLVLFACATSVHVTPVKPSAPPPAPILPHSDSDAWRKQQPAAGTPARVEIPAPNVTVLENGMTIYTMPRTTGIVSMSVVIKQGAETDPPGKSGLAALVVRMLTESTRHRNAFQLAETAESFGSTLQSSAQRDQMEVSLDCLPEDTEHALAFLSEVIREPSFSGKDFERVRSQWLDDLLAERQSPSSMAVLVGMRALYGVQRGAPVNGSVSDVKGLLLSDLRHWYAGHVVPSNTAIIVVGPMSGEAVVGAAKHSFGSWHASAPPSNSVEYPTKGQNSNDLIVVDRKGAVQSALFAIQPFPRRSSNGFEARQLLSDMLGGLFTSRINMNLREVHAYTYGAHSSAVANRNFGAFVVQTNVKTDSTAASLKEMLGELSAIAGPKASRPISEHELGRASADLIHRLGERLEYNRSLAGDLETLFVQGLRPKYYSDLPGIYAQLSLSEVANQSSLIQPNNFTIVVVGDSAKIEPALVQAGFKVRTPEATWLD